MGLLTKSEELLGSLAKSRLLRGGMSTGALRVLMMVFMLLSNLWITNRLSDRDAGTYLTFYGIVYFLAVFGQLGLRTAVVRWIAESTSGQATAQIRSAIAVSYTHLTLPTKA